MVNLKQAQPQRGPYARIQFMYGLPQQGLKSVVERSSPA
jgi:hypothetical protein